MTFSSPNFNPSTGTFELRASFENPNNQLRPQQYVRAIVKGATYVNAIVVPQIAVQEGSKGHFVWVITKDNKAQFRPVEVGSWIGNDWLINRRHDAFGQRSSCEDCQRSGPEIFC